MTFKKTTAYCDKCFLFQKHFFAQRNETKLHFSKFKSNDNLYLLPLLRQSIIEFIIFSFKK